MVGDRGGSVVEPVSPAQALDLLGGGLDDEGVGALAGRPLVAVALDGSPDTTALAALVARTPCVVVAVADDEASPDLATSFDIALTGSPATSRPWVSCAGDVEAELAQLAAVAAHAPEAAVVACQVLRVSEALPASAALLLESLAYSTLQAGRAFAAWLADRQPRARAEEPEPAVLCDREGDELTITLNRPQVHNALDTRMREALVEALRLAVADPTIEQVVVRGAGATFCSGGDLVEFGTLPDPSTAHLVRTTRHPARWMLDVAARTTVHVHGTCVGAGAELSSFAHRVVADPATTFRLPEVAMGLIPGAGGTVSIPRRIGRQRATWLALANRPIDAKVALDWGLVDEVVTR